MNYESIKELAAYAGSAEDFTLVSEISGYYPYIDSDTSTVFPAAITAWQLETPRPHLVVLACFYESGEPVYKFWCGDKFLENLIMSADHAVRLNQAFSSLSDAGRRLFNREVAHAHPSARDLTPSTGCNFWKVRTKQAMGCKHTQYVLDRYIDQGVLDSLEARAALLHDIVTDEEAPTAVTDPLLARMVDTAFKANWLLKGERGEGKTFMARELAERLQASLVECPCNNDMSAADFVGSVTTDGCGGWVWLDGPITEAFRRAAAGENVVLFVDEMLRTPARQLSVFLHALSAYKGTYSLKTGRVVSVTDGVGRQEVITVPQSRLMVIAATNVGASYAIEESDPALEDRFIPVTLAPDAKRRKSILDSIVAAWMDSETWESASKWSVCMAEIMESLLKLKKQGQLRHSPNIRNIQRAFDMSKNVNELQRALIEQAELWVEFDLDGLPIQEQLDAVRHVIDKAFKSRK